MTTYYRFTEVNPWEGETWHFYLPIEGNEANLAQLAAYLDKAREAASGEGFNYSLDTVRVFTRTEVDSLVKGCHDSEDRYMPRHTLASGVLGEIDMGADPDRLLYKARVLDLFEDE